MNHWKQTSRPLTCPLCRQLWEISQNTNSNIKHDNEGYLDFGNIQGQSRYRDT